MEDGVKLFFCLLWLETCFCWVPIPFVLTAGTHEIILSPASLLQVEVDDETSSFSSYYHIHPLFEIDTDSISQNYKMALTH